MIKKITGNVLAGYLRETGEEKEAKGIPESAELEQSKLHTSTPAAEVELSKEAQLMQKAVQAAKDAPDVRTDVVQGIQNQLQAGTYSVNHQKLAEKLSSILA